MTIIPDPTDDKAPAIVDDERGVRLAPAVLMAPLGTDIRDKDAWTVCGYLTDPDTVTGLGGYTSDDLFRRKKP